MRDKKHGFMDANGVVTLIDYPGATNTDSSAINDHNVVVGAYFNSNFSESYGFAWANGEFRSVISPVSPTSTVVNGINNNGVIDGNLDDSGTGFKAVGCTLP